MNFNKKNYVFLVLAFGLFASCSGNDSRTPTPSVSSETNISTFTIPSQEGTTAINYTSHTISVAMPLGESVLALVPTITTSDGATISPLSGVVQNFTSPVTYTVTEVSGARTQVWVVTVRVAGQVDAFEAENITFNMMYVPGGLSFPINTGDSAVGSVGTAYWIAETEVTYELWDTVRTWAEGTPGYTFANPGLKGSSGSGSTQQPVTTINWRDAMIFSNALTEWYNEKAGTNYTCVYYTNAAYTTPIKTSTNNNLPTEVCYVSGCEDVPYVKADATGFRLPTKREWELAARYKGSDSTNGAIEYPVSSGLWWTPGNYASGATDAYDYNYGASTDSVAWYDSQSTSTQTVGFLDANTLGLYDMSGNVMEWLFDWYSYSTLLRRC